MGPNGSGKSTLAYSIAGHPKYTVTDGTVTLDGQDVLAMTVDERARAGLFLAMQYPVEVPGVSISNFLRTAATAVRGEAPKLRTWVKEVKRAMKRLDIDPAFAERNVNEGFSGGEKKRHEMLQLELLKPKIAILDETDSGLDVDALRVVSRGRQPGPRTGDVGVLLITHYTRILRYITPGLRARLRRRPDRRLRRRRACRRARERGLRASTEPADRQHDDRLGRHGGRREGAGRLPDSGRESTTTAAGLPRQRATTSEAAAVLDAEREYNERHNANVHRGIHTLAEEATALYEGGREKVADFIGAADPRRDRLHQERHRGSESARLLARSARGSPIASALATRSSSPRWSTTRTSCPGSSRVSGQGRRCAGSG